MTALALTVGHQATYQLTTGTWFTSIKSVDSAADARSSGRINAKSRPTRANRARRDAAGKPYETAADRGLSDLSNAQADC